MKTNQFITLIAAALISVGVAGCATEKKCCAKLEAQAKVSRADAEKTALAKVPGGSVKEGEIEMEKGKLIWSFDISTPGSKDITEVAVDAKTGEVVSVDVETPEEQAKEKAEDAKKEKKDKDDDEKEEKGEHK